MNKVALIIGAGDAIGGAIAKKFAKQGMTVCVTRRTESKIIELAKEINQSGGKAFGFACDARKEEQTISLFKQIEEEIGDLIFSVINLSRKLKIDPENALRKTNNKFSERINYIEKKLQKENKKFNQSNLIELEKLWNQAKMRIY